LTRNRPTVWWPDTAEELIVLQRRLAEERPPRWQAPPGAAAVAACFVTFSNGNNAGSLDRVDGTGVEKAWGAVVTMRNRQVLGSAVVQGTVAVAYEPGLLALREGRLLESAVRSLTQPPDLLLVNATGRDHPRRAGLALHLGAALDLPTIGVTDRPLLASGDPPADHRSANSPLLLEGELVGYWLRTRSGSRPVAVHEGWRVEADTARSVVMASVRRARTPQPLRRARHIARLARVNATGANRNGK
jgi:deoxyribonuclease V